MARIPSFPSAASLPDDLIRLVASHVLAGDFLDYVRFRAVCIHWRSATASSRGRGIVDPCFHPRQWMMLPEGDGLYPGHPSLHDYIRLFNLNTGGFVRVQLPVFRDKCIIDSFDGLLVLQRDHDTAVLLLHPFTGDILELPPLSTLLPLIDADLATLPSSSQLWCLRRSVCTAATFVDGAVTVMLVFPHINQVTFATPQDRRWTMSTWLYENCASPFSFQGKIFVAHTFATDRSSKIYQMDTPLSDGVLHPPKLILKLTKDDIISRPLYFVECNSEVLVVGHSDSSLSKIVACKLADLINGRYIPVTSIGDNAFFIQERTLCVNSKALPTITGDTVVYTHPREQYFAQYNLRTGMWSPAMDEASLHGLAPGPCSLMHHIITCSSRQHWNKGLLLHSKKHDAGYGRSSLPWVVKDEFRQGA